MLKFKNVDILKSLEIIMRTNTECYQSDFDCDRETLTKVAKNIDNLKSHERIFLWMSRPCGTWCFNEQYVFMKDTFQYNTWKYYGDYSKDNILAYAVEVVDLKDGQVIGNIYELDYQKHFQYVKKMALSTSKEKFIYEHGEKEHEIKLPVYEFTDKFLGKLLSIEPIPDDYKSLKILLEKEQQNRECMKEGNIETYLRKVSKL